ncbi:hypothetical protein [Mesorhizobium sp. B1-1-5]|uniref:hypothetical protein n=1 Tax=Mesorhizobium sp. B1-1-5 TaxID=2589979 RepID=UPI0015E3F599|nr:hypothetical protein [Mesorhizobium sp. B1-1-5]
MTVATMAARPAMPLHAPVADRGGASRALNRNVFASCSKAQPLVPLVPPEVPPLVPPEVPPLVPPEVPPLVPPEVPPLVPPEVPPLVPPEVTPLVPLDVPLLVPPEVPPLVPPEVPLLLDPPLLFLAGRCSAPLPPPDSQRPGDAQKEARWITGAPAAEFTNCRKSLATCAAAAQAPPATTAYPTTNPTIRMKTPASRATPGNYPRVRPR